MDDDSSPKMTLVERITARQSLEAMRAVVKLPEHIAFLDDLESRMPQMNYQAIEDELNFLTDKVRETMSSEEFMRRLHTSAAPAYERGWRALMRGEEQPPLRTHRGDEEAPSKQPDL